MQNNKGYLYVVIAILLFSCSFFVSNEWLISSESHTLMELTATLIALFVSSVSLIRFYAEKNRIFLFIGTGFLGTAVLDGYHAVLTSNKFIHHFAEQGSLIAWSWNASRIYLALLLILSYWVWTKPDAELQQSGFNEKKIILFLFLLLVSVLLFFFFAPLPQAYYDNTFFGRPEEFLPAILFAIATFKYYQKGVWRHNKFEYWLIIALLFNVICQSVYMPFSRQVFDGMFISAHSLKIVSYLCVLTGLLFELYYLHKQQHLNRVSVEKNNAELSSEVEKRYRALTELQGNLDDLEKTRAELSSNKIFLDAVLDNMEEGVVACNTNGELSYFNKATVEFHGKDVKKLPPEKWSEHFDLYHADGEHLLKAEEIPLYRAYKGEDIDGFEMIIAPKNGQRRFVVCYGQQMHDQEGHQLGAVVTMHDISEQKETELKLRDSEERFRGAFESAPNGIALIGLDGKWLRVNPALCKMLGYTEEEFLATDYQSLTHADDIAEQSSKIKQLLAGEIHHYAIEKRNIHKEGHYVWVLLNASLVHNADGQPLYLLSQVQDISVQKELEREREAQKQLLIDKETAESANKAKSQFLANMSHELRTPLNAIIGYSEMLAEEVDESVQGQMFDDLNKIRSSGKHLLGLINDILDLSKVEAGKMDLQLEHFSIHELLYDVTSTIQSIVKKNSNSFETNYSSDVAMMYSDSQKIKQILFNLLSNASKFTTDGKISLTVRAVRENISQSEDAGMIEFIIADNGIGMNDSQMASVFSAFTQADSNTTRKYGGTGLGLAITERFCQLLGGAISVTSSPGQGSVFTVSLPVELPDEIKKISENINNSTLSKENLDKLISSSSADNPLLPDESNHPVDTNDNANLILIIDDDPTAREILSMHLTKLHYNVIAADNGMQGISLAKEYQPKVIILDLMMPNMNGWAVLHMLKDDPQLTDIPVILCSIISDQKETGYALGASDFLLKPIDRNRLQKLLGQFSSAPHCRLLIVEDDMATQDIVRRTAEKQGLQVAVATNGIQAINQLEKQIPNLILLDLMMPGMDGFQLIQVLQQRPEWRDISVIIMTAKNLTAEDHKKLDGHVEAILGKGEYKTSELIERVKQQIKTVIPAI